MEGERYRNSALAEEFLVEGRPRYFGGFVRLCDQRGYLAWHDVIRALRTDQPLTWDPKAQDSLFASEDPLMLELFWEAMHSLSQFTAKRLGELYDFTSHRRLLDVGGGSGAFLIELCRRYAHLSGTVFDLERICPIAEKKILEAGLEEVIDTHAGDFRTDECLPGGYDVILLSSILHDWDEATGRSLLRKCWQALEPGGVLLICELLLNPERSGPPTAALMGLNMIVQTVGGRNYSESEYLEWLAQAGFAAPHLIRFEAAGANGAVGASP
jgi:3-hydroxy-5-methyl-1-naphthoate 3-O-methyltransferase